MPYPDLARKVVLVTGASKGIGYAIASEFAEQGSRVAANYHTREGEAKELKNRFAENVELIRADLVLRAEVASLVDSTVSKFGRLDVVVNNAGKAGVSPIENFDEQKLAIFLDVNLKSALYVTDAALPHLKKSRGCIVNIASSSGIGSDTPTGQNSLYSLSKSAVIMLTKRSAFEFGKYGIRVNAIAPGWIRTEMTLGGRTGEEAKRIQAEIIKRTYLGMVGLPEHVSGVATFLASEAAAYVTGQVIVVDGGRTDNLTHSD